MTLHRNAVEMELCVVNDWKKAWHNLEVNYIEQHSDSFDFYLDPLFQTTNNSRIIIFIDCNPVANLFPLSKIFAPCIALKFGLFII